jgi:diguanylate cyclase (GGDEF)-like protein/PAS domain S-box-containing protein
VIGHLTLSAPFGRTWLTLLVTDCDNRPVSWAPPSWLSTVAAEYAAHGAIDDALVVAATAAEVGLVRVFDDGGVWWSDETYRLHGRPRWVRVRSLTDLAWGLTPSGASRVRAAYTGSLTNPDVEVRYTATGEHGPDRDLVLRALDHGVLVVHRAAPGATEVLSRPANVVDIREGQADAETTTPDAPAATDEGAPEAFPGAAPADVGDVVADPHSLAQAVLEATPDLVLLYDLASRRVLTMAGNDTESAQIVEHMRTSTAMREDVHPHDFPLLVAWRDELDSLEPGEVRHTDARFRFGGEWRWREIRASEFRRDEDGTVVEVVLVVRDVHEQVEAGHRIAESERAFREVFDASPVGLAVLDAHGRFTAVNDAFCILAGRTREAVLATVYEALLHPEDRAAAVISRARSQTQGTTHSAAERRLTRADGASIWVRVRTSEIDYSGSVRTLVSIEDVTISKATEDQLRHDALHDELTGLPNRRLLIDRLERALTRARRGDARLAIYFIDLDDLKRVNDTHPWQHRAGDVLLTSTATAVRETLREADTLGRLGGDEFVAICEDVGDDSTITDLGDRILDAVRQPLTIGGETITAGASIGIAVADDESETAEHLLRRADAAMYAAKTAGGSRVVRADAPGDEVAVDLVGALARRELRLHYQPVVSLSSGSVLGVSTVVKWRHPERGMLPGPEVRAAMGAGASALPVVHWALDRAISDVRTVAPTRVDHVSVWLPVPGRAALAASTRAAVAKAIAGPEGTLTPDTAPSLVLDIHEQDIASLTKRRALHHHLHALLDEGPLALGVERFTADAVPIGTLQLLSAASVSIDPDLLTQAAENEATEELVRSLVAGAGALGVITIAMDVESQEQLDLARSLGIHAAYGDLIGPPAPLDTYSDLLHGGRMSLPETEAETVVVEVVEVDRSVADVLSDDADDDTLWSRLADTGDAATNGRPEVGGTPAPGPREPSDSPRPILRRAEPVIDAPPPTTPRVDLGDDIGSALAAELGIELPPLSHPDAPRITRTMTASLSDRITSSRRDDQPQR